MNATANTKMTFTPDALASQTALELPDRHLLGLVTVLITNLLNNNTVTIEVKNNNVAVQVCAVVEALTSLTGVGLSCDVQQ